MRVFCEYCGKEIDRFPSQLKLTKHHFCSEVCRNRWYWRNDPEIYKKLELDLSPSPTLAYILGVLKGDGNVNLFPDRGYRRPRIRLKATSLRFVYSFHEALKKIGLNPHLRLAKSKNSKWRDAFESCAYSREFYEWYQRLTLDDIYELIKSNDEMVSQFIRGLYESEGSLSRHWLRVISNTNLNLVKLVQTLLLSRNFKTTIVRDNSPEQKGWKTVYHLNLRGGKKEIKRFLDWIKPCIKTTPSSGSYWLGKTQIGPITAVRILD
jgi:intein-encoded DNA endonuclease-like protein